MRLLIASSAILISLGLNTPVMSVTPIQIAQKAETLASNLRLLKLNEQQWKRQNINSYRYTVNNSCYCIPDFRVRVIIQVTNGVTTSITSVATGQAVNPELFKSYSTIPHLFNVIREAIKNGQSELTVKYDRKLGYPTQINIGNLAADAGIFTTIENFQILK